MHVACSDAIIGFSEWGKKKGNLLVLFFFFLSLVFDCFSHFRSLDSKNIGDETYLPLRIVLRDLFYVSGLMISPMKWGKRNVEEHLELQQS